MRWIVERFEGGEWAQKRGVNEYTPSGAMDRAARALNMPNDQLYKLRVRPFGTDISWEPPPES